MTTHLTHTDPLLAAIADAAKQRAESERKIRHLIAYARVFAWPRPYTLASLAEAAGMSISGVRTAYNDDDIEAVTRAVNNELPARPKTPLGRRHD